MRWLKQLFNRRRHYNEISESIREHIEEKVNDLMDLGMNREQAERAARREFGNVTLIEERSRCGSGPLRRASCGTFDSH